MMSSEVLDLQKAKISNIQDSLEKISKNLDQPAAFINTHHFAEGVYVRAYYGVKDSVVVSQVHLHENITILARGHCRVISTMQEEERIDVYRDFAIFKTLPYTKRALYFLEDTTILTVHPNPENITDIELLEERLVKSNFTD